MRPGVPRGGPFVEQAPGEGERRLPGAQPFLQHALHQPTPFLERLTLLLASVGAAEWSAGRPLLKKIFDTKTLEQLHDLEPLEQSPLLSAAASLPAKDRSTATGMGIPRWSAP